MNNDISFLNETGFGLENKKNISQYWVDNMRMMHAICNEFSVPFISFFQPNVYISKGNAGPSFHKELLELKQVEIYRKITEQIKDSIQEYDYIVDLTKIFDNKQHVYMDDCHVFEFGNEIIATEILKNINKFLLH